MRIGEAGRNGLTECDLGGKGGSQEKGFPFLRVKGA